MLTSRQFLLAMSASLLALPRPTLGAQTAQKRTLTLDGARRVIAAAEAAARRANAGGVIAVVDDGGHLMALERLDGTFAAGAEISAGKARTAVLFKRPTKFFEEIIRNGRTPMIALDDFTPLQGGVPILVDGHVVGGVGVSGASSAQQDEELAIAGAAALGGDDGDGMPDMNGTAMREASTVSYWDNKAVKASFEKGAVLFDGAGNRNYMVHTSRREKPGMAEVHAKDTDIIYVTGGSATLVTGGSVVEGRTTAADEVRGLRIDQGEERRIRPGDVIIVPRGTPHWFRQVDGPLTYYVVKVR